MIERPATEVELVAIVGRAAAGGRAVAVGHAAAKASPAGGALLIDLSGYDRLLRVDRDNGEATVEAGISLRAFGIALGSWGLSLENGGGDPGRSLGAAVSVGAHGTGAAYGGVATQVSALRLVAPDGSVVCCSATQEPAIFNAALIGLGAVGVISTVTVRCEAGFNLRAEIHRVDLDRALADFDSLADGNDHFELSWLAGRRHCRVTTANRTDDAADGRAVDRGYRWFSRRRATRSPVEFSFPRREAAPALRRVREIIGASRWAPPFPIVVSVTAADDIALSPAEGRPSVYIAGVAGLDGRPQWRAGDGARAASHRDLYPRFGEWQAVRDRLDPDGRFAQTSGQG